MPQRQVPAGPAPRRAWPCRRRAAPWPLKRSR